MLFLECRITLPLSAAPLLLLSLVQLSSLVGIIVTNWGHRHGLCHPKKDIGYAIIGHLKETRETIVELIGTL